jgi:hypothetical protein
MIRDHCVGLHRKLIVGGHNGQYPVVTELAPVAGNQTDIVPPTQQASENSRTKTIGLKISNGHGVPLIPYVLAEGKHKHHPWWQLPVGFFGCIALGSKLEDFDGEVRLDSFSNRH